MAKKPGKVPGFMKKDVSVSKSMKSSKPMMSSKKKPGC